MSRTISAALNAAILAQESDKVLLTLLEIAHDDFAATIRLANNLTAVTHGGETYSPYYFALALPKDDNGQFQSVQLVMDNTDRQMVLAIRALTTPPAITIKVVLADSPDTVEILLADMILRNVSYNVGAVSGDLIFEERLSYQVPSLIFTPVNFPGCF